MLKKMNRDFLLQYIFASLLILMLLSMTFVYNQEHQEQQVENELLVISKKIELLDLQLNQAVLQMQLGLDDDYEITRLLKELSNHYQGLSGRIGSIKNLDNKLMQVQLNELYLQLRRKNQAIEKFKRDKRSVNQHLSKFQQFNFQNESLTDLDLAVQNKIYYLQRLILESFLTSSKPNQAVYDVLHDLTGLTLQDNAVYNSLIPLIQHSKILLDDQQQLHLLLNSIIQNQAPIFTESIERKVICYFEKSQKTKNKLQNSLLIITILSVLYVLYLLSHLRKKSWLLEQIIADVEMQQTALNEHAIVSIADVAGNITYVNKKFCEISGYSAEELLGQNHRIIKSDFHSQEIYENIWHSISQGHIWHGEIQNKNKSGGFYWIKGTIMPFLNVTGNPYQYISIRTDITYQKELEKKLQDKQHFLKQVLETMAQGLYALDVNGLCTVWNKEAEHILGWSESELLNKKLHEIIHFQEAQKLPVSAENCIVNQSVFNNDIYRSETEFFTHKDGRILPISIIAVPLLEKGKTIGTVAVFSDITKRKVDEKTVNQAMINARQANQAKSDFLANMSHEIRTPMNGIIGMTELALETELTPEQKEFLEIVKDSSYALLAIVNDILDFSKIESGKIILEHIPFDINELLKKIVAILIPKAEQKELALSIDNTMTTELSMQLIGDPGRLRQVILNLVGNAIKFTLQGSIKVSVVLAEKNAQKCCLLFAVADTGIGISEDKQATIFEAFSQADTSVSRRFGGTGLGLSISKRFIELMAGEIWLESEPNVGTTFFFTCWFDYENSSEILQEQSLVQSNNLPNQQILIMSNNMTVTANENKLKLNILLAEDNLINQKLAKKLLEKQGYQVQIAHNGLEAVALFEQQPFDLILMDFQMPEMNGLEAAMKIREIELQKGGHIPIIAMTANAMKEDKDRAINAGMDAYVPKPINVQELLTQISLFFPESSETAINQTEPADGLMICNWEAAVARLGGEVEILEMMANLFLEEQGAYLDNIKYALAEENASLLERELHTLRGICATLGGERIEKNIKNPEALAVQQDFAGCRLALVKIEQDIADLAGFLHNKKI